MNFRSVLVLSTAMTLAAGAASAATIEEMVANANAALAADGKNYQIEMAETLVMGDNGGAEVGQTILFKDRGNKQLTYDFVPGDPRRAPWSNGTNITYALDDVNLTPDIAGTGELSEIRAAMGTWENVQCSNINLIDSGNTGVDVGVVQFLFGYGGIPGVAADVQHVGFLPPGFFLALGSSNILGVTFTFRFVDGGGNDTDIDGNGLGDTAFREIYYNDGFTWETDPADQPGDGRFDLQTVALHEAGHGLSQAHFGQLRQDNKTGKLHFSPLAVMNAGYVFGQQQLAGTDRGGHCSNWGSWPNN